MIRIGQKTVKPPAVYVVWVPRLFGILMMNVMGNNVDFFGDDFNDQVSSDLKKKGIRKFEGPVSAIAVEVNGTVSAHQHHAVHEANRKEFEAEVIGKEKHEGENKRTGRKPTPGREPVSAVFEDIESAQKFAPDLT